MSGQAAATLRATAKAPASEFSPPSVHNRASDAGRHIFGSHGPQTAPGLVHEVLQSPGRPLAPAVRASVEPLFGRDFSRVRIHNDAKAAESARSVNALAYTVGRNIVFDGSNYAPATRAGGRLLIHELAHTVQQGESEAPTSAQKNLNVSRPGEAAEREADSIADRAAAGERVSVRQQAPVSVHRSVRETLGDISIGLGAASAVAGGIGLLAGNTGLGLLGLGVGAAGIIGGLLARRKPKPPPTSIRLVQVHQAPIDDYAISLGLRWGMGGVSEIEVSNGNVDYDGSDIEERFVSGQCGAANRTGVGAGSGSTFSVGYGFTNRTLGRPINLPAKHNVFYDQHLRAGKDADPPPGQNLPCTQQYLMDGAVIAGQSFDFSFDVNRQRVAGENVSVLSLVVNQHGAAAAQPPAANPQVGSGGNAPAQREN